MSLIHKRSTTIHKKVYYNEPGKYNLDCSVEME